MKEKMKQLKKFKAQGESSKYFDLSNGTFLNLDRKMESTEQGIDELER